MTEKKASRNVYVFSKYLNEVCRLYTSTGNQEVFTVKFKSHLKRMIAIIKDSSFGDIEKYRNLNCVNNCLLGHSIRTTLVAMCIAKELRLNESEIIEIGLGAVLHDTGKIFLSRKIMDKPSKLSENEFKIMKKHSEIGFVLFKDQKWLPEKSKKIILNHHERLDGSGYPNHLSDDQIHLFERIVSVSDVFDAMTSKRNYREALSYELAFQEIIRDSFLLLDARIVLILGDIIEKYRRQLALGNQYCFSNSG